MSLTLDSVSSPVVNGRCTGCGRFISRNESHFHSPPRKFRGRPKVHRYDHGDESFTGALVTRCDDPVEARLLVLAKIADDEGDFPLDQALVQRGRVIPCRPESEYGWTWRQVADDVRGPGITTAVVW